MCKTTLGAAMISRPGGKNVLGAIIKEKVLGGHRGKVNFFSPWRSKGKLHLSSGISAGIRKQRQR